ncbi:MAG: flagellar export chaperone FliS [Nitrospinota bacterium]
MPNPYSNYRMTEINTASPVRLIVLLYEGAIRNIKKGEILLQDPNSFVEAGVHLLKAMDIVSELMGCLKPDSSPEISDNLSKIYAYVIGRIGRALQDKDPAPLAGATEIMSSLSSAWAEIDSGGN